jgi:tetratricopeptide (TPR) repeat protein
LRQIENWQMRIFVVLGLVMGLLGPVAFAQKPAPPPPSAPPRTPPTQPGSSVSPASQPTSQPETDFVMFLTGHVAAEDGSHLPSNVMVERVCNAKVRQQVYADPAGDFSMQLGSVTDSTLDASADGGSQSVLPGKYSETGIPRQQLANCELRALAPGFRSRDLSLVALDSSAKNIMVGTIVVHRSTKVEGTTVDAAAYKAPKDAVTAFQKGLDAQRNGKLADARRYFEKAVDVYPAYARAWFHLGTVLEKEKQKDAARTAYTRATTEDAAYLPPYLSLAVMACAAENWTEAIRSTNFILALDPFKDLTGYTVELDSFTFSEAYFYNALANYQVKNFVEAERNALKAERLLARIPDLHLLLGDIFARRNDYPAAIGELQTYLELVPHADNVEQVRERQAELKKRNDALSTGEKSDPQ